MVGQINCINFVKWFIVLSEGLRFY